MDKAKLEYEQAAKRRFNGRPSVAGVLALAALAFNQGNYQEALAL